MPRPEDDTGEIELPHQRHYFEIVYRTGSPPHVYIEVDGEPVIEGWLIQGDSPPVRSAVKRRRRGRRLRGAS